MKTLPWILAGIGAGAAIAYVVMNQLQPQPETGWDSVENAAGRAWRWGSKNRVSGIGTNVGGKLKEGLGRITGDTQLADEGVGDQVFGSVSNAMGTVARAAGQTIHDLNR